MFRRVFANAPKFTTNLGGISLAAAAANIAISDADLKKKPKWYQQTEKRLEKIVRKLSIYSYVEDVDFLDEARDLLQRCENVNNCEISWRLARALTERAESFSVLDIENRVDFISKAIDHCKKAFNLEPAKGCAGAHKWYAIALRRLKATSPSHPYVKNADKEAMDHLQIALRIDPKDAIVHHLLGILYYEAGKYDQALKCFLDAEDLQKEYFPANIFHIGLVHHKMGKKEEALKYFKQTFKIHSHSKYDRRAKAGARVMCYRNYSQKPEDIAPYPDY